MQAFIVLLLLKGIYLFMVIGAPDFIHSDNGPEFANKAVKQSLHGAGVKTLYAMPFTYVQSRSTNRLKKY